MERISLTIAPGGENHHGMEILGEKPIGGTGFTCGEIGGMYEKFTQLGYKSELLDLKELGGVDGEDASVLIVRNFVRNSEGIMKSLKEDEWDKKYLCRRRGKVLNKHARHNLCYMRGIEQKPFFSEGKGSIVDLNKKPILLGEVDRVVGIINESLVGKVFDPKVVEGNHYYNPKKTGIGFHGDTERTIVVAFSIGGGENYPMKWQWYKDSKRVGNQICVSLGDSDMYIMSEKAVGTDWKRRKILTLRHAAGCDKYTK